MDISAAWHKCISLKPGGRENLIFSAKVLESLPEKPGIYIFVRQFGRKVHPLYIGRSLNVKRRIQQHIEHSTQLLLKIDNAGNGKRSILYCTINLKPGQSAEAVLKILEMALISHALAEGHELFNEKGVKFKQHTIEFQPTNRASQQLAPRLMRVRSHHKDRKTAVAHKRR